MVNKDTSDTAGVDNTQDAAAHLEAITAQMKQNEERLAILESENASLKTQNALLLAASRNAEDEAQNTEMDARNRFQRRVEPMRPLDDTTHEASARTLVLPEAAGPTGEAVRTTRPSDDPHMVLKRLNDMEAMLKRLPGVAPPITKSAPNCYADTPFTHEIALVEMPKKFTIPSMIMYDGTKDPDNHIAQYKQRMFTTAIAREYREASMCKGFGSSLTGPAH
ncbi:hypothetical protein AALP_AA6G286200 [Arabis alpina]|uniref:Uncharacterized protein n=1 Tax=Arabis alpina TaxID=50452 RepID=A0A087GSB6_ARAAL|nr:hypothetical protein AALP_AA6G286200 [Arabis alpina]